MLEIGTVVRVINEDWTHHAKIGDVGVVVDSKLDNLLLIVEFEGKEFPNGGIVQALEMHDVEVVE